MQSRLDKLLNLFESDPNDPFIRYGIALEYKAADNLQSAIRWFEELRNLNSAYVPTYYMLAECYRLLDQFHEAETVYRAGITAAQEAGDTHALSELHAALEELQDELP